jgi:benzoate 4-monooxygenase
MGEWSFGAAFGFLESGRDDYNLIQTLDMRSEVLNALGHLPLWIRPYMKYLRFDPFWYNGLRSTANLGVVGLAAYKKRAANSCSSRKDLLSFLFNAKDPDTGGPLPEQEIIAEAISFIGGGSHTTSHTMTHIMDFVSRDQNLQDKIWEELCEAFPGPRSVDWVAPEEMAGRLPLLGAVLKEVMRIRPTSSTGPERVVPDGGKIVGGVFIPGGTLVSLPLVAIHHDEAIYEVGVPISSYVWVLTDQ